MNEVFDINKLPDRRLVVRKTMCIDQTVNIGEAIRYVKRDMAMQLATTIIESDNFFKQNGSKVADFSMLEYWADCIVLTSGELSLLKRESFADGLRHARGFVNMGDYL